MLPHMVEGQPGGRVTPPMSAAAISNGRMLRSRCTKFLVAVIFGRRRMYVIGAAATGVFGFIYFALLDTVVPGWVFLAIVLSLIPHDMMYGPQAALIAECFTGRLRYSGASLGYQLASIIAGGPAPLIATALFAAYKSGYAIALFIFGCAVVSLISAALLPDYTGRDISAEYDRV